MTVNIVSPISFTQRVLMPTLLFETSHEVIGQFVRERPPKTTPNIGFLPLLKRDSATNVKTIYI